MTTITIRRSVSGEPIQAPGLAGAMGATQPTGSNDIEVSIEIDSTDPEVIDRVAMSAAVAFNVIESFTSLEPGVVEFIDEPSQTETDHVSLGEEETQVDGKSTERLGLQDGAAYYVTATDGDKRLMVYDSNVFEDRDTIWSLDRVKSFRLAAPAVSN